MTLAFPLSQDAIRRWLRGTLAETGLSSTALARAAGLAPSTLNRFLNSEIDWQLSTRTLGRIQSVVERRRAEAA